MAVFGGMAKESGEEKRAAAGDAGGDQFCDAPFGKAAAEQIVHRGNAGCPASGGVLGPSRGEAEARKFTGQELPQFYNVLLRWHSGPPLVGRSLYGRAGARES